MPPQNSAQWSELVSCPETPGSTAPNTRCPCSATHPCLLHRGPATTARPAGTRKAQHSLKTTALRQPRRVQKVIIYRIKAPLKMTSKLFMILACVTASSVNLLCPSPSLLFDFTLFAPSLEEFSICRSTSIATLISAHELEDLCWLCLCSPHVPAGL